MGMRLSKCSKRADGACCALYVSSPLFLKFRIMMDRRSTDKDDFIFFYTSHASKTCTTKQRTIEGINILSVCGCSGSDSMGPTRPHLSDFQLLDCWYTTYVLPPYVFPLFCSDVCSSHSATIDFLGDQHFFTRDGHKASR